MVQSKAATVKGYLKELPADRRTVVSTIRGLVLKNLPAGYEEVMNYGMIVYQIPLERYPETYNGQPLMYAALAAQKNHYALYLMAYCNCAQREAELKQAFARAGKKLDMGKSCLRFRKLDDLPLDTIGEAIAAISPEEYIQRYEANRKK